MPTGILELKLGASLAGPTKRMAADLFAAMRQCNQARNAMLEYWLLWHRDRQNTPETKLDKETTAALSREMYRAGTLAVPNLSAKVVSSCLQEVRALLKARMPYNHIGSKYRWQAILNYEVSLPSWTARADGRGMTIPVPNQDTYLAHAGVVACGGKGSPGILSQLQRCADNAVLRFPLHSNASGRKQKGMICRVHVGELTKGNRALLRKIVHGEDNHKLQDSKIVYKPRNKAWFYQLTYKASQDWGLNQENVATLLPDHAGQRDAFMVLSNGKSCRVGHAVVYRYGFARCVRDRKVIQQRYREGGGDGAVGHGRARVYKIRPMERARMDLQKFYRRKLVSEVLRACRRGDGSGKLIFLKPSKPLRKRLWLAQYGLDFDWTRFESELKYKCEYHGIELEVERIGLPAYRERFCGGEKLPAARKPEPFDIPGHAELYFDPADGEKGHDKAPLAKGKVRRKGVKGYGRRRRSG